MIVPPLAHHGRRAHPTPPTSLPTRSAATRAATEPKRSYTSPRLSRSRWLWPAVAAAAVVVLAITATVVLPRTRDVATTSTVTVTGNIADIGGVRFPLPAGWTAAVTATTDQSVTACVAAQPTTACTGIELSIAIPNRRGDTNLLPSVSPIQDYVCPDGHGGLTSKLTMVDDQLPIAIAGRPGVHCWAHCDGSTTTDHLWQLNDLSLQIYAAPAAAQQGIKLIAGLDLASWSHHQGPQAAFFTRASTSPAPVSPPTR